MADYKLVFHDARIPSLDLLHVLVTAPEHPGGGFRLHATLDDEIRLDSGYVPYDEAIGGRCRVERTEKGRQAVCHGVVGSLDPVRIEVDGDGWSSAP